jgi:hypothetical protein
MISETVLGFVGFGRPANFKKSREEENSMKN